MVRGDIKQWNQLLAETPRDAGVITSDEFAIFQNAGYIGLYGGLKVKAAGNANYNASPVKTVTFRVKVK